MLSDEEKKAVFQLKDLENDKEHLIIEQRQAITTILNLIEKQSKEIEDNKKYIDLHYVPYEQYISKLNELNKEWEDKIKARIEELENYYRELYKQDNSPNEFLIGQDCLSKLSILQEVKQSLLEKE